jgi:hypothetical protein
MRVRDNCATPREIVFAEVVQAASGTTAARAADGGVLSFESAGVRTMRLPLQIASLAFELPAGLGGVELVYLTGDKKEGVTRGSEHHRKEFQGLAKREVPLIKSGLEHLRRSFQLFVPHLLELALDWPSCHLRPLRRKGRL